MGIKVTAFAGIYLGDFGAGGMDTVGITGCALVAFYDIKIQFPFEICKRAFEQGCFSRPWRTYKIQCQDILRFKVPSVSFAEQFILVKDILFHINNFFGMAVIMIVIVMIVRVC
jgi:hypothetical protein